MHGGHRAPVPLHAQHLPGLHVRAGCCYLAVRAACALQGCLLLPCITVVRGWTPWRVMSVAMSRPMRVRRSTQEMWQAVAAVRQQVAVGQLAPSDVSHEALLRHLYTEVGGGSRT